MLSRNVSPAGEHKVTAPSALSSGEPFQATETGSLALILNQIKDAASGDAVVGRSDGTYEFPKASATAAAADAAISWDTTNKLAVTAGGDFVLGKARGAVVNGKTVCRVELNA